MTVYSDRGEEQCIWGFSHHCFWHNSVTPIGHTKARGEKRCSPPALSSLDTWLSNSSLTLLHPPDVNVCELWTILGDTFVYFFVHIFVYHLC